MANPQVLLYELNVYWCKKNCSGQTSVSVFWIDSPTSFIYATTDHHFQTLEGRDNQPGDDMLGAGAVKTNPTDRFNSASPEKIPDGDNAGML
ncbi:hypothetical protein YC2023_022302 [Brassica napus]